MVRTPQVWSALPSGNLHPGARLSNPGANAYPPALAVDEGRGRMANSRWLLLALVFLALGAGIVALPSLSRRGNPDSMESRPGPVLRDVGPRLVSNQTSQPLALYGSGFAAGLRVALGPPFSRELPATVVDATHAYTRLPPDLTLPPEQAQAQVTVSVRAADGSTSASVALTVINDASFPDLTALARSEDGRFLFAASPTTDTVFAVEPATRKVTPLKVGDGPVALGVWRDALVVAHTYAAELRLVRFDGARATQVSLPGPAYATGLAVDAGRGVAYVAEHARDTVSALSLEDGRVLWTTRVLPNPRELLLTGGALVVGSLQAGQLQLLDTASGKLLSAAQPEPGLPILGGRTEPYSQYILGGKAPRALAFHPRCGVLVSSIGPNVGPNPDRMEVSMNGGVSVVSVPGPRFLRHLGFGAGVPEGLAVDEARALLYVADIGLGRVRVVELLRLCAPGDARARGALIQELPIPPPAEFPRARPAEDYGVAGRAGVELHSGPRALALSPDGQTLYVLNRFTGTLAVVDARGAGRGQAALVEQLQLVDTRGQRTRRLGQVLYHSDLGRTAMSCDACHLEGHTEGVFFAKTRPMRIYRAPTLRGSLETPPYFTPASTRSLAQTAQEVGSRNRFHSPSMTPQEIEALALFNAAITTLPNPFVGADGAPVEELALPDGARGNPRRGLALFEGRAACAGCHPAPHFTTDQDPATRGRTFDVGTPRALPIREQMQELLKPESGPPSLLGTWDVFPLLTSGAAGFAPRPDGALYVKTDFPHREVLELAGARHGNVAGLSGSERDDLLAYLWSL